MEKFIYKTKTKTRQKKSCIYLIEQDTEIWTQRKKQYFLLPLFLVLLISSTVYANATVGSETILEYEITCTEQDNLAKKINAQLLNLFLEKKASMERIISAWNPTASVEAACLVACGICVPPASPVISVIDNNCNTGAQGAFTVTTACEAGSTVEWSSDNGITWSTTVPTYDATNAMTVIARCVDDGDNACISAESAAVTSSPLDCGACSCKEYLYLNDTGTGEVHKFSVDPTTGEIAEIGSPWMSGFTNPHGLGSDINGNLYIGDNTTGPIYKISCDGGTVADDATLWFNNYENGLTNISSYENYIITTGYQPGDNSKYLTVHEACTGNVLGQICLNDAGSGAWSSDWGLQILNDGTVLATDGQGFGPDTDRAIWKFQFDPALINSATCIDALASSGNNTYLAGIYDIMGVTSDGSYLYVMTRDNNTVATLLKVDANTGALVSSATDDPNDGVGWNAALGLVYAPSSGYLYISGYEDCIAIVDPNDLSYVGPGNGTIPFGSVPKAIAIKKECCPNAATLNFTENVCVLNNNEQLFLQNIFSCGDGIPCGGEWIEVSNTSNGNVVFNSCDASVTLSGGGCASYELANTGTVTCPGYTVTVNICIQAATPPEITVADNDCAAGTLGSFLVITPCGAGSTLEWSTDNGTTWTTTAPAYGNAITAIARCVNDIDDTCLSTESAAATSSPDNCCPTPNCFGISVQQN